MKNKLLRYGSAALLWALAIWSICREGRSSLWLCLPCGWYTYLMVNEKAAQKADKRFIRNRRILKKRLGVWYWIVPCVCLLLLIAGLFLFYREQYEKAILLMLISQAAILLWLILLGCIVLLHRDDPERQDEDQS